MDTEELDVAAEIKRQSKLIADRPMPNAIYVSPLVPEGQVYSQYATNGDWIVWISQDDFDKKLERHEPGYENLFAPVFGIPVFKQ